MRRPFRWLAVGTVVALIPKCVLCVLAYVGVGAAAVGRAELCGAPADRPHAMIPWLVAAGAIAGLAVIVVHRRLRRGKIPAADG